MTTTNLTTLLGALFLSLLLTSAISDQVATGDDYNRLYEELHTNKLHRHLVPRKNMSSPVILFLGAALINFEGLDESNGVLHLALWMRSLWRDDYMKWDPNDYGGITTIRMPLDRVWNPDIKLYNARGPAELESVNGVVYSDGNILYVPPARTKSHCSVDLTYFPFDKQTCILKFGSWTYDGHTLDMDLYQNKSELDLNDYIHNQEWDIIGSSGARHDIYYPCCEEPYPDITYNLTIQRKTNYYTYVYVGPAVVLSLLAPFIFLLPPGDQQKMTLGVGLLVCFTLFFMEIATALPTMHGHAPLIGVGLLVCFTLFFMEIATALPTMHGHAPLIDKYYMTVYVLLCMAMALSTLVSNLARRASSMRHPPEIIKTIMLSCLGRCLCVSGGMYDNLAAGDDPEAKEGVLKQSGNQVKEWMLIATVVDRLLFLVYLVLTILLTIIILSCRG